jgi:hypothetical protein
MIACAINERMQRKLDYTQEEVRVLKEIVAALTGNGRLSFSADQRRRLAVAGKALSPEERKKCCQIVKPGTILGWFRQMAARKYDSSEIKVGRPRKRKDIRKLVVEMANSSGTSVRRMTTGQMARSPIARASAGSSTSITVRPLSVGDGFSDRTGITAPFSGAWSPVRAPRPAGRTGPCRPEAAAARA